MNKKRIVIFWILFPIISTLIFLLLLFYLDLANGPVWCLTFETAVFAFFLITYIIFRKYKFTYKLIPISILLLANVVIIPLAKPSTEVKNAYYYNNPVLLEEKAIANGKIQGVYNKDQTVEIYAGIPYAKAPVGELRWKEPQDVENWDGVKDCTKFAAKCMQNDSNPIVNSLMDIYSEKAWHPNYKMSPLQNKSEDCLYLNVWKPVTTEKNLPILVYIHGGSLTGGSSAFEDYNGEEMAKQGVIMITIQYRLGVFGFFAHEELIDESSNGTTGNYGLLDQIKALEWVKNNAKYFDGNPNNVTVAGESAGSSSVSAICTSPLVKEKHLIKRAIGESSSLAVKVPPHTFRKLDDALKMGNDIMKEYNCNSVEELRNIPAEQLVKTKYTNSAMTVDGYALTKTPYQVYKDHENNEEALLNGYNILEGDAFVIPQYLFSPTNKDNIKERLCSNFGDEFGEKIYNFYQEKIEKDAFSTMNEIFSVYWFMYPHYSWANLAKDNGVKVYSYQFTKENGYHGTYHAGELIYAYGNVKNDTTGYRYDATDLSLSSKMVSYWANFAKTGNPNGSGLPTWEAYTATNNTLMELGTSIGPKVDTNIEAFKLFEEYISTLD